MGGLTATRRVGIIAVHPGARAEVCPTRAVGVKESVQAGIRRAALESGSMEAFAARGVVGIKHKRLTPAATGQPCQLNQGLKRGL